LISWRTESDDGAGEERVAGGGAMLILFCDK
jgi:hypothetical protein